MSNLLIVPVSQERRLGCFLGRPEYPISHLPRRASPVKHVFVPWTPIDGIPGVAPGAEGIEPSLSRRGARNGQGTHFTAPNNVLLFLSQ